MILMAKIVLRNWPGLGRSDHEVGTLEDP